MDPNYMSMANTLIGVGEYVNTIIEGYEGNYDVKDPGEFYCGAYLRGALSACAEALEAGIDGNDDGHIRSFKAVLDHIAFKFEVSSIEHNTNPITEMLDVMGEMYGMATAFATTTSQAIREQMLNDVDFDPADVALDAMKADFCTGVANGIALVLDVCTGRVAKNDAPMLALAMSGIIGMGFMDHEEILERAREVMKDNDEEVA